MQLEGNKETVATTMKLLFIEISEISWVKGYTCGNFTYLFVYLLNVYTVTNKYVEFFYIIEKYLESRVNENKVTAYKLTGIVWKIWYKLAPRT